MTAPGAGRKPPPPLRIESVTVEPPLVLAPMAGLTDRTFRRAVRRCGGVGLVVSEIASSEGLTRGCALAADLIRPDPEEHPIALQISGADPERMAEAAALCGEAGADLVDINMGCPVRKVTRNGAGAALMRDPDLAARIVESVRNAVSVPVTAKFRLGWSGKSLSFLEMGRTLVSAGAAALTLHARTRDQMYGGDARWEHIARLKEAVSVPVIGNGDVRTPEDAAAMMARTGCDGVMIGREAVKNPWIFRQSAEVLATGSWTPLTFEARIDMIRTHFEDLLGLPDKLALHRMKTFLGKYTKGVRGAASFRATLQSHKDPRGLLQAFEEWATENQSGD